MIKSSRHLAIALICPVVIHAAPVAAQDDDVRGRVISPPSVTIDLSVPFPGAEPVAEHFELFETILSEGVKNAEIDSTMAEMGKVWEADVNFAKLEAQSPGLIAEMTSSVRPILVQYAKRVRAMYKPRMVALFAHYLTPAEAASMNEFYNSESGRRISALVLRNASHTASMENAGTSTVITRDQLDRDTDTTLQNAFRAIPADEVSELNREIADLPALQKMNMLLEPMKRLHVARRNEPLLKEEELAVTTIIEEVLDKRFR